MPEVNGFVEMKVWESLALHKRSYKPYLSSKDYLIRKETFSLEQLFQGSVTNYFHSKRKAISGQGSFFLIKAL